MVHLTVPVYLLAEETMDALQKIWKEAECDETVSDKVVEVLLGKIQALCLSTIEEEKKRLDFTSLCDKIQILRNQIDELWKEAFIHNELQRSKLFPSFFDPKERLTDISVKEHELYLSKFINYMSALRPLLHKVARREAVVEERMEFENIQQNPDRLKSRGPSLEERMKEDAMALRVKHLDKITDDLVAQIQSWESEHGHFLYLGVRYFDRIKKQNRDYLHYRDSLRLARRRKHALMSNMSYDEHDDILIARTRSSSSLRSSTPSVRSSSTRHSRRHSSFSTVSTLDACDFENSSVKSFSSNASTVDEPQSKPADAPKSRWMRRSKNTDTSLKTKSVDDILFNVHRVDNLLMA